jgi:hypothetical protein
MIYSRLLSSFHKGKRNWGSIADDSGRNSGPSNTDLLLQSGFLSLPHAEDGIK